jgi:Tol biopolymer transport system component
MHLKALFCLSGIMLLLAGCDGNVNNNTIRKTLTSVISVDPYGNQVKGNSLTLYNCLSENGRIMAFEWREGGLTHIFFPSDTGNVYARDTWNQTTICVSVDRDGHQAQGSSGHATSTKPSISNDGRYIVFTSDAIDLLPGAPGENLTNGNQHVFCRDLQTGTTELISRASNGEEGLANSEEACISGDGRYVAFASYANNLITEDPDVIRDIFIRDRIAGTTEKVTQDTTTPTPGAANGHSYLPPSRRLFSSDGTQLVFHSWATNLIGNTDDNVRSDVFVRNRGDLNNPIDDITEMISHIGINTPPPSNIFPEGDTYGSRAGSISYSGRYVVFNSTAKLLNIDNNGAPDIYIRDRDSNLLDIVSMDSANQQGMIIDLATFTLPGFHPSISGDGNIVVFLYSGLSPQDLDDQMDVYSRNLETRITTLESIRSSVSQGLIAAANQDCYSPTISGDGMNISFLTMAANFLPDLTPYWSAIFKRGPN